MTVTVGITAHPDPARFRDSLNALTNHCSFQTTPGPVHAEVVVLVDASLTPRLPLAGTPPGPPRLLVPAPGGGAARFNRLASHNPSDLVILLEAGALVHPGWMDGLIRALAAHPAHGLAGPATNLAWNEQRIPLPQFAPSDPPHWQPLTPLHSLGDFCYAVRREVIDALGAADESYGQGPCWEMDYNIRAARAGWVGVWTRNAYVQRIAPVPAQRHAESIAFTASKHRYQDKFCGARLSGVKTDYRSHCRGDACPNFAPAGQIAVHIPLPEGRGEGSHPNAIPRRSQTAATNTVPLETSFPASLSRLAGEGRGEGSHPDASPRRSQTAATGTVPLQHSVPASLSRPAGESRSEGSKPPRVSCIMPTFNRVRFIPFAVHSFLNQSFTDAELLIVDDGTDRVRSVLPDHPRIRLIELPQRLNTGAKRNFACSHARGEIIVHWDDDDWYPLDRLERQVAPFDNPQIQISGTSTLYYHDPNANRTWRYAYAGNARHWVAGNTLAYRQSWWRSNPFPGIQVGEDNRFVWTTPARAVADLRDPSLCVARIHPDNTSPKRPLGLAWNVESNETAQRLLAADWAAFVRPAPSAPSPQTAGRLVSCIMPTGNRRSFVELALRAYALQDYPHRELIVVDDGDDSIADLLAGCPDIRHIRVPSRMSIGRKRQIACEAAQGEFIAHWDDDDWYAPGRLSHQLAPLLAGTADLTGLENAYSLDLATGQCWRVTPELHARMFVGDVHGGTLVYRRSLLRTGLRYPDRSLAEDAALIQQALRARHRLAKLENPGLFVYIRHGSNAWRFRTGTFLDAAAWHPTVLPERFQDWLPAFQKCLSQPVRSDRSKSDPAPTARPVSGLHRPEESGQID